MVTRLEIINSLKELGIKNGDTVLFHSSLKSFGKVENGADDVIDAFLDTVGQDGTVVVPTLSMKNFNDAYDTWSLDKPSDTGLITEVFRLRSNALRSNQETHSVAAIGANAELLTKTHGESGLRYGIYGDSPFAKDSPWQKLYDMNATVVMVGIDFESFTLRHLCEYTLVEKALNIAKDNGRYEEFKEHICNFYNRHLRSSTLFWPYIDHVKCEKYIIDNDFVTTVRCGEAVLSAVKAKDVCDFIMNEVWNNPLEWFPANISNWYISAKYNIFPEKNYTTQEINALSSEELLENQPENKFIEDLKKPLHVLKTDSFSSDTAKENEINMSGMFLKNEFDDAEGLLETAFDDFNKFIKVYEIGGSDFPVTTRKKITSCFEEYTLTVNKDGAFIEAADTEGIRRGLIYLEDLLIQNECPSLAPLSVTRKPIIKSRITRSFFSPTNRPPLNIDELFDDVDYYPDEYLNRIAHDGNNGVWIYTHFPKLLSSEIISEYGEESKKALAKLQRVVNKCKRYGIKVYVFGCEPVGFKDELAEKYKHLSGAVGWDRLCFCPRTKEGKQYCIESTQKLFTEVKGLGGYIDITAGERVTSCASVSSYKGCPRCSKYSRGENLSYAVNLIKEGMRRANTDAEFISWAYGHREWKEEDILEYIRTAPDDVKLMQNFEEVGFNEQLGKKRLAVDYWISYPGPAETFVSAAKQANASNKHFYAKMQICNSHEIASVPYIPAPDLIYDKYTQAYKYNVEGVLQCWYMGNFPSIMSKAAGELYFTNNFADKQDFLEYIAGITYGKSKAKTVAKAYEYFSNGYKNVPTNVMFSYYGPLHDGICWDLSLLPKNVQLPRSWCYLDRLDGDRIGEALQCGHTLDEALILCEELCKYWNKGVEILNDVAVGEMYSVAKALNVLFSSATNVLKFYKLREQLGYSEGNNFKTLEDLKDIVKKEIENCDSMITLCENDNRLGYHSEAGAFKFYPDRIANRKQKLIAVLENQFKLIENRISKGLAPIKYYTAEDKEGYNLYTSEDKAGWCEIKDKGAMRLFYDNESLYFDIKCSEKALVDFAFEFKLLSPAPQMRYTNGILDVENWHRQHHSIFGDVLEEQRKIYCYEKTDFGIRIIINHKSAGWKKGYPLKLALHIDGESLINDPNKTIFLAKHSFSENEYKWLLPQ